MQENSNQDVRREGYYESRIYPGMFFCKYLFDVELNGQAGLTPTQFAILSILDDEGGEVAVSMVKGQCWKEEPPSRCCLRVIFRNSMNA